MEDWVLEPDMRVCSQCNVESDRNEWKFDDICRTCSLNNLVEFVKEVTHIKESDFED